jgi:hypothetical protein
MAFHIWRKKHHHVVRSKGLLQLANCTHCKSYFWFPLRRSVLRSSESPSWSRIRVFFGRPSTWRYHNCATLGTISSEVTCCHQLSCLSSNLLVLLPPPFFPVSLFLSLPGLLGWTDVGKSFGAPWPALGLSSKMCSVWVGEERGRELLNYVSPQVGSGHWALRTVMRFYDMLSFGCYGGPSAVFLWVELSYSCCGLQGLISSLLVIKIHFLC